MPLLTKCNVTNMSFPSCTADNNDAFAIIIAPTRLPKKHPSFKSIIKDIESGKEYETYSAYNRHSTSMVDYAPIGIFFKGFLSEYGELEVDFDTDENIRALKLIIYNTMYQLENDSTRLYDPVVTKKYFDEGKYQLAWSNVAEALRFFNEEKIFIKSYLGDFIPITMSLVRGDAFEKMMSNDFMEDVYDSYYHSSCGNGLLLEERMDKAEELFESAKSNLSKGDFGSVAHALKRGIAHSMLEDKLKLFGHYHRETITSYILGDELDKLMFTKDIDKEVERTECIQIIKDMLFMEYIISCFEYLQIEFRRANTISMEDYGNYYTYKYLQFITPLHEEQQALNPNDDGYETLVDRVAIFSRETASIYGTYVEGGDIRSLERLFGEIDESLLENTDCNSVIYYDKIWEHYGVMEDHEFMKRYKEV